MVVQWLEMTCSQDMYKRVLVKNAQTVGKFNKTYGNMQFE